MSSFYPKIAIIDDGINTFKSGIEQLEDDIIITSDLQIMERDCNEPVRSSHGTICAAIIKKYAPQARFSSVSILNNRRQTKTEQLVKAFEWCLQNNIDILNVSLGSTLHDDYEKLKDIVEILEKNNRVIVAACSNDNKYTYPASMKGVIGVRNTVIGKIKNPIVEEIKYRIFRNPKDGIDAWVAGQIVLQGGYVPDACNSYATAYISSVVANAITDENMDATSVLKKIEELSVSELVNYNESEETESACVALVGSDKNQLDIIMGTTKKCFSMNGYNCLCVFRYDSINKKNEIKKNSSRFSDIKKIYDWDILVMGILDENINENDINECDIIIHLCSGKERRIPSHYSGEVIEIEEKKNDYMSIYQKIIKLYERK